MKNINIRRRNSEYQLFVFLFFDISTGFPENSSIDYKTNVVKKKLEIKIAIISIIVLFFFFFRSKNRAGHRSIERMVTFFPYNDKKETMRDEEGKKIEAKRDPNVIRPFARETVTGMETTFNDRKHVFSPPFPAFRDDHLPIEFETKTNVLCQFRNNLSLQNYISFRTFHSKMYNM